MNKFACLLAFSLVLTFVYPRFPGIENENSVSTPKQLIGVNIGYGNQKVGQFQIDTEHDYEVIIIQGQYNLEISRKRTWSLDLLLLPQFNYSKFIYSVHKEKHQGFEAGLGIGLQFRKRIVKDDLDAYLLIAVGPHYVSGVPEKQDPGFIFSDAVGMGLLAPLLNNLHLNMKMGLRHLSNAGLQPKNAGINNLIVSVGVLLDLNQRN
jgi:hypothetical protein